MKKRVLILISFALMALILFTACAEKPHIAAFANRSYFYSAEEHANNFTININLDGTFSYIDSSEESYIGLGDWKIEGNRICLTDSNSEQHTVNYFTFKNGSLFYSKKDSTGFPNIEIKDGEKFEQIISNTSN